MLRTLVKPFSLGRTWSSRASLHTSLVSMILRMSYIGIALPKARLREEKILK